MEVAKAGATGREESEVGHRFHNSEEAGISSIGGNWYCKTDWEGVVGYCCRVEMVVVFAGLAEI